MAKTDVRQQLRKLSTRNTELHGQLAFYRAYCTGLVKRNKELREKAEQPEPLSRVVMRLVWVMALTFGSFALYPYIGYFTALWTTGFLIMLLST